MRKQNAEIELLLLLKNVPYIRHKIFANFKMYRIYGTRNVCIWGRIYFENQKMLAFDIGLKCSEKIVSKNFEKMKCTVIFGPRNVCIWRNKIQKFSF
jgi:hypothetical protein